MAVVAGVPQDCLYLWRRRNLRRHRRMVDLGSIQLRCEKQQQSNRDNGTDESAHDRLISFDSDRAPRSRFERLLVSEEMNN
jgi:hypothetical protein